MRWQHRAFSDNFKWGATVRWEETACLLLPDYTGFGPKGTKYGSTSPSIQGPFCTCQLHSPYQPGPKLQGKWAQVLGGPGKREEEAAWVGGTRRWAQCPSAASCKLSKRRTYPAFWNILEAKGEGSRVIVHPITSQNQSYWAEGRLLIHLWSWCCLVWWVLVHTGHWAVAKGALEQAGSSQQGDKRVLQGQGHKPRGRGQ